MPLAVDDDDGDLALTLGQRVAGPEISTQRPHHLRKPGVVHPDPRPAERTAGLDQRAISLLLRRRAKLRQQGQQIPIIMLTGSDAKTDVVRGPNSGANDYIVSRSEGPNWSRDCARRSAPSKSARTPSSSSAPTPSAHQPRCYRPERGINPSG